MHAAAYIFLALALGTLSQSMGEYAHVTWAMYYHTSTRTSKGVPPKRFSTGHFFWNGLPGKRFSTG